MITAGPTDHLFESILPAAARGILGGDNVLAGRFEPVASGLSSFRGASLALAVPGDLEGSGYAIFPASAVGLSRATEPGTSVRNQLTSRIRSLEPVGPRVEVQLECGVLAAVTREAVRELGFEAGAPVVLEIKATAIRPLLRLY